jgi:pyridoxamine 5'-phosphate oxidase-like protein
VTAWRDVERAEPAFAQRARALFDAHRHKTIATLRSDGSPRISGIEAAFEDGELVFGSMPNARKGADLRRDPRFALHSATVDPVEGSEAQWPGEAKISGRAIAAGPFAEGLEGDRFHADIAEVVHTHLNEQATMLVVEWWTPRQRAAKDRPRLTVEAGPGPGHEQGPAGDSLGLGKPWLVSIGRRMGLGKISVVGAFALATCNTVGSDQCLSPALSYGQ